MKRILFASDLTERSRRAGARARLLQGPFDARLTAVHVLEEDLPDAMLRRRMQEAEESIRASLKASRAAQAEDTGNVEVEVVPGVDHDILAKKSGDHDLVVLGMHRARFVDAFVGTTADRVMRSTDRPVLMVKDDAVAGYGRVLIAVDLSPSSKRAAAAAAWLAPDAQFFLARTYRDAGEARRALEEFQRILELYPNSGRASAALYQQGLIHVELGNTDEARSAFEQVLRGYPDSPEAELAQEQLSEIGGG